MIVSMRTILIIAASITFFVIVSLAVLMLRAFSENRRLRVEKAREREDPEDAARQVSAARLGGGAGAYSYDSIVMDEVVGEKLVEELKRSLRMTEEMYQKLSERFKDDRDRRIEFANDWLNYLEAIDSIKQSRIDYRMNSGDGESVRREQDSTRVKLEIENKFKNLLQSGGTPAAG